MWPTLGFGRRQKYEYQKLIDYRQREVSSRKAGDQVVCDIDKTYLETDFESWIQIARTALESPEDKITAPGARELLLALRWSGEGAPDEGPRALHFVSSSPPQMRSKLEEKLLLDGIDWTSDTFKNQAYNLRMGRVDLLRQHVAYKSMAILRLLVQGGPGSRFHLIGDSAESDAYIYLGVWLLSCGLIGPASYVRYLINAGVEEELAKSMLSDATLSSSKPMDQMGQIVSISIRLVPGAPLTEHPPLTQQIHQFSSYFDSIMYFIAMGLIDQGGLFLAVQAFNNKYGMTSGEILARVTGWKQKLGERAGLLGVIDIVEARLRSLHSPGPQKILIPRMEQPNRDDFSGLNESQIVDQARLWIERHAEDRRGRRN